MVIEDKETTYKDSFGNCVDIGDTILISYRNQLLKAVISHVTKMGNLRVKFMDKAGNLTGSMGSITIGSFTREFILVGSYNNHKSSTITL